jgi:hypothetical protein
MKVTVYPTNQPPYAVVISTFSDLQKIVGGDIQVAKETSMGDLLVNEEGLPLSLPRNQHYPNLVGDVVLAPKGWGDLPYGD